MNETLMFMSWSMAKKASKNQDNVFWLGSILCSTFEMGPKKLQVTFQLLKTLLIQTFNFVTTLDVVTAAKPESVEIQMLLLLRVFCIYIAHFAEYLGF